MAADSEKDAGVESVDAALQTWRQGDYALGEHFFVWRTDQQHPLTATARAVVAQGADLVEEQVPGLVLVSQTCDIVRSCKERPFVEACPLVEVDESALPSILRCQRPAFAPVPALMGRRLVADLDRTMTLEKSVVAKWSRQPGWTTDEEIRAFAQALSRKRARFAYPDDFAALARKLIGRLSDKHGKDSEEGRALRALREIRVQASPDWNANDVEVLFWFVQHGGADVLGPEAGARLLKKWLELVPKAGRFVRVDGSLVTLHDMTGADYVGSDPLDLDHLSR